MTSTRELWSRETGVLEGNEAVMPWGPISHSNCSRLRNSAGIPRVTHSETDDASNVLGLVHVYVLSGPFLTSLILD